MKILSIALFTAAAASAGCGTVANNSTYTSNANLRGTNTNTGYVTNSDATVKPTVPPNATNLTPTGNGMGSKPGTANSNAVVKPANANSNRKPSNGD